MSDPFDPHEALAAVERLERDLDDVRRRTRRPQMVDADTLRAELDRRADSDRARGVDDLAPVMDVLEAAWHAQRRGHDAVTEAVRGVGAQVHGVAAGVDGVADAVRAVVRDELVAHHAAVELLLAARLDALSAEVAGLRALLRGARVEMRFGADAVDEASGNGTRNGSHARNGG